ncbi:hypothetical protein [Thalassotalea ganghwensis]
MATPVANYIAIEAGSSTVGFSNETPDTLMGQDSISNSEQVKGQGAPIDNRQSYLALHYIICIAGIFPPRN